MIFSRENMETMKNKRRDFIKKSISGGLLATFATDIVFADKLPQGIQPLIVEDPNLLGKHKDLVVLNERPWNIETPAHLLDDAITPLDKMFVRNNGTIPENVEAKNWTLTIEGESVKAPKTFTLDELKKKFKHYTYQLQLECAGNGRSGFSPQTAGNQWHEGAISCAEWTGIRVKDLLQYVGLKEDAVYIGYYGKDKHLSGDTSKAPISRGVPITKALEEESLLAWQVNGQDIPLVHGFPLRLIFGGWPASTSGKWVEKIVVRNKVHDGEKMDGTHYRVPAYPVEPGSKVAEADMKIIESMPVKSLITYPRSGAIVEQGKTLPLRGHAWAGDLRVSAVHYSIDFGATWQTTILQAPKNRLAWQQWSAEVSFPSKGYYEIWVKATDSKGVAQPMVIPAWNPAGYLNNACHRIAVKII